SVRALGDDLHADLLTAAVYRPLPRHTLNSSAPRFSLEAVVSLFPSLLHLEREGLVVLLPGIHLGADDLGCTGGATDVSRQSERLEKSPLTSTHACVALSTSVSHWAREGSRI